MEKKINTYFDLIKKNKPIFIPTKNSYDRLCLYKALEKYKREKNQIWYNRKKKYIDVFCNGYMCKLHKCELSRCDEFEGDFWCDECYYYKKFLYDRGKRDWFDSVCIELGEKGDFLYKTKATIGLNIYYKKPIVKCIKDTEIEK